VLFSAFGCCGQLDLTSYILNQDISILLIYNGSWRKLDSYVAKIRSISSKCFDL
jgi:hypothetical protein